LQPGTRYFFWINASDWGECHCAGNGSILSFTTPDPPFAARIGGPLNRTPDRQHRLVW
jgi:hypothetical protein